MFVAALLCAIGALLQTSCSSQSPETPPAPDETASLSPDPARDWTTYDHDAARTGEASVPAVAPKLPAGHSIRLDGAVYGQPLVVGDVVFAATENDSVYAISARDGSVIWRDNLAVPHPRSSLPCGDIDPLGITGTPVFDPATRRLYAVAEDSDAHHLLFGLDAATGDVTLQQTVDPPSGDRASYQQRPALTLADGRVYAAFGGLFGDCGTYTGAVASVDPSSGRVAWYSASTSGRGGIWAPGAAVVAGGDLYFSVGNGNAEGGAAYDGTDSVLALTPDLKRADFFAPAGWPQDNANDSDLGSMNPALVNGHIVIAGKAGVGYVATATRLGGIGGQTGSFGGVGNCQAFGAAAISGDVAYLPCASGTTAVRVAPDGTASVLWHTAVPADGPPILGGGVLWVTGVRGRTLYALDPATGRELSETRTDGLPHFASPSLAAAPSGTRLFLGTSTGIEMFALTSR